MRIVMVVAKFGMLLLTDTDRTVRCKLQVRGT